MKRLSHTLVPAAVGLSILALFALRGDGLTAAAGPSIRLADVLPDTVVAYVEIPDGNKLSAAFEQHPWARLVRSDAMAAFRDGIETKIDEGLDEMPPEAGKLIRGLLDATGGHLELAVLPQAEALFHFVARAGVGANAPELFATLTEALRAESFVSVVTEGGLEIVQIDVPDDTVGRIDLFVANGSILIGNDRALLMKFVAGEAVDGGFAANASYRTAHREAAQRGAHVNYLIDLERYLELAMSREDPELAAIVDELEMDGSFSGWIRYDPHGAHERGVWSGYSPDGLLAKLYATMKPGLSFDRRATARAGLWFGMRLDMKAATNVVIGFVRRMAESVGNERVGAMIESLTDADASPVGISVTDDLIAALDDEISFEVIPPRSGVIPDVILRASVADPEKLNATLKKMAARVEDAGDEAPFKVRAGNAGGTAMYVLSGPGWKVRPAFAIKDGQFVASLFAPSMREALEAPADPLPKKASFRAALARLGRSDTSGVSGLACLDWFAMLSYARNAAEPFFASLEDLPDWVDFDSLPEMAELEPFLPPSFGIYHAKDGRQTYETTGPFGNMAALASMLAAARMFGTYAMDRADGR